jgi:serine/threonine protein kinase
MLIHNDVVVLASEFAEGGSLKGWLGRNDGKAPSNEAAVEMMLGILKGIEHLHARHVVHRDLKPDNILLQGEFPRIADFGVSRMVSSRSMSTKAMGSPGYMSPESFEGSKLPQTDIWSAGVILYEMLSGGYPFHSETIFGLVVAIQRDEAEPLPETVPPELRRIVETALSKDLSKRYQSAREMRLALEQESYNLRDRSRSAPTVTVQLPNTSQLAVPALTANDDYSNFETISDGAISTELREELRSVTLKDDTETTVAAQSEKTWELSGPISAAQVVPTAALPDDGRQKEHGSSARWAYWAAGGFVFVFILAAAGALIAMSGLLSATEEKPPVNKPITMTPQPSPAPEPSRIPTNSPLSVNSRSDISEPTPRPEVVKPVYSAPKKEERSVQTKRPTQKPSSPNQNPNCIFTNSCK